MPALPTIQVETMLLGWQRSHNGGSKIILQIPDEELVHFEKMTVKKGKVAGQRLAAVFVEIGPDEKPVQQPATLEQAKDEAPKPEKEHHPLGALSKWAVMRCQDPAFQAWVREAFNGEWIIAAEDQLIKDDEGKAKAVILSVCGIQSRKELDTDERAAREFNDWFRRPYAEAVR